ncbi:MAG: hypothetical protein HYX93_06105 [Chloroflexi bacterium]|nr:hypothetical protein [Chloroflexota bacterium]
MPWVTWIETVPEDTTDEAVHQLYERTRMRRTGQVPDTVRLTSLTPEVAGLINDLSRAVHVNATGLSRREQEVAALIVSVYNGCVH